MKINLKSKYTDKIIFSHDAKNNSIKLTVELAVKNKISLTSADLSGANLSNANLTGADLTNTDLSGAKLFGANLSGANLTDTDLTSVDLTGLDLSNTNMKNAKLFGENLDGICILHCLGDGLEIQSLRICNWDISFSTTTMSIECKQHSIKEWMDFTDQEIAKIDKNALQLWTKWKDRILKTNRLTA